MSELAAAGCPPAPPHLDLPLDRPRPPVADPSAAALAVKIEARTAAALGGLAAAEGADLGTALAVVWAVLMGRLAGQPSVVVGLRPAEGAAADGGDGRVSLAVELGDAPTARQLLRRGAATPSPYSSFAELLSAADAPPRTATGERSEVELGLRLAPSDEEGTLAGALIYRRQILDAASVERIAGSLRTLLAAFVAEPDRPVDRLPLLAQEERRRISIDWNATERPFPRGATIHGLVLAQARRTPRAVAISAGDRELTYGELDRRSAALARRLRHLGVGPEVAVGVGLERGPDLLVALLAILRAGGLYVPLDPGYPAERLSFMLEDSRAPVLVSRPGLLPAEALAGRRMLIPDEEAVNGEPPAPAAASAPAGDAGSAADPAVDERQLAYLIYTSGSTGRPKGVAIPHRAAATLLFWAREVFTDEELSGVLASTSVCFDLSVFELFLPLAWGGRVILVNDALALLSLPPEDAAAVRLINTVPSAAAELARAGGLPPRVVTVNLAGEPLKRALVNRLYDHPAVERVYDLYGPSEDTTYSTFSRPARDEAAEPHIGRPIARTRAYVLDRHLAAVPIGVTGELYLAGHGLARGYLHRPALTAERFVPDPFSPQPGGRLYRTGDLARWRSDGNLDFLGRADHQVKVRGFRIELGEIEAALLRHPAVRECVVTAWGDEAAAERRLVAYLAPEPGASPTAAELSDVLEQRLPAHMIPALFVVLPALPRTPNGKVDRRALPDPATAARASGRPFEPLRGETEELLAAGWRDLLEVERVGALDDFFELGGHSLLATRVVSRLRSELGVELPLERLFGTPILRPLAAVVDELRRQDLGTALPPLVAEPRNGSEPPLSFSQERLWFLDQLLEEEAAYNIPFAFEVRGPLDPGLLGAALAEVERRHEVLRTVFPATAGRPRLQLFAPRPRALPLVDLSGYGAAERQAASRRLMHQEARRPFDLGSGPLLRLSLVRRGTEDHLLLMTTHHIASDGISMEILMEELGALYTAFGEGRPSPLPPLAVQYSDYARWQRAWLRDEVLAEQSAYWLRQLEGIAPLLPLPADRPRPPVQSYRGATLPVELPAPLEAALRRLAQSSRATLFMVLLAALQVLLARLSGHSDVTVGTPIDGRRQLETERLMGFFINTLVLRGNTAADPPFRGMLEQARETALAAYTHQDLPFEKLVQELEPERSLAHAPLFQVMLVLENRSWDRFRIADLDLVEIPVATGTSKFDLLFSLSPAARGLVGSVEYNTDLFDPPTVERLAASWRVLLATAAADPECPVGALPLLSEGERRQLLDDFNAVPAARFDGELPEACVHHLFAARAGRWPEAAAVTDGERCLSYGELRRQAHRLAHRLAALGVAPDVPVGISTGRTLETAVAVLAVLAAGGAYLPLDPAYPAERLAFMLEDSGAPVLLTHGGAAATLEPLATQARILRLEEELERSWDAPDGPPPAAVTPDHLAYLIYTSGSTGRPKGVAMTHRALANLLAWQLEQPSGQQPWTTLQFASLSFDVSFQELFSTWCAGGTLVLVPEEVRRDPAALLAWIEARRVERIFVPFVALQLLAEAAEQRGSVPASLKWVVTAGEQLQTTGAVARLFASAPEARLENQYGPSECHVVTAHPLVGPTTLWPALPPIGRPIARTRARVLDRRGEPQPVGVTGELYLGGVALARGYLGRPSLTAERFVPDPFAAETGGEPGDRLYRTGDLARWRPGGALEFLGRADHQVKVRGFRVEPGEIEVLLGEHPAVVDAVVVPRGESSDSRTLVAWVVAAPGRGVDPPELKAFLADRLPEHMVPGVVVPLEELPLTPSGKVDRRALIAREPTFDRAAPPESTAPRSEMEELLADLWAELLGTGPPGVRDNFFDLGGHSLHATRHMARLRELLDLEMPVRCLFEAPTIERLAVLIEQRILAELEELEARP